MKKWEDGQDLVLIPKQGRPQIAVRVHVQRSIRDKVRHDPVQPVAQLSRGEWHLLVHRNPCHGQEAEADSKRQTQHIEQ